MDVGKASRWLRGESARWVKEGLIREDQAQAIRALYPAPQAARPWAVIIFSGLGAVIVGLGVILLFAYNWKAMPKAVKLGTIATALIAFHGSGIYLFLRRPRMKAVGESLTVAGTMFFGAGIWLVAQIYHIQEHFATAFLIWGIGALLMAWALPSVFQGVMAAVLFAVWAGAEAAEFDAAMHLALPVLLGAILPLAYRERSRVLLACLLVAAGSTLAFLAAATADEEAIFISLFAYAVLAAGAGAVHRVTGKARELGKVYHVLAVTTYMVLVYILSFGDAAEELLSLDLPKGAARMVYWVTPGIAAVGVWAAVLVLVLRLPPAERRERVPVDLWLVPGALLAAYALSGLPSHTDEWVLAGPFNLILLAHAVSLMARGVKGHALGKVVCGAVLLTFLTGGRYVDLLHSLVARGLVFLLVGGALFTEGIFYARGSRLQEEEG